MLVYIRLTLAALVAALWAVLLRMTARLGDAKNAARAAQNRAADAETAAINATKTAKEIAQNEEIASLSDADLDRELRDLRKATTGTPKSN